MVGVLTMAAAAAPPPVEDFEIEVRLEDLSRSCLLVLDNCGVGVIWSPARPGT